jgi:hypothetical protein
MAASGSEAGAMDAGLCPRPHSPQQPWIQPFHTYLVWMLTNEPVMPGSEKESGASTVPGVASTPTYRAEPDAIVARCATVSVTGSRCGVGRPAMAFRDRCGSV